MAATRNQYLLPRPGGRPPNGSFTLTETDSGTDSDSDSKPNGYIVLCKTFHIAQTLTWIPTRYSYIGQESESESVPESVPDNVNEPLGSVYTKRQRQHYDNSAMMLAILFSLKSVESLENRLQPHSGATPLFSMRTKLQASWQSCRSIDADAQCKWALRGRSPQKDHGTKQEVA